MAATLCLSGQHKILWLRMSIARDVLYNQKLNLLCFYCTVKSKKCSFFFHLCMSVNVTDGCNALKSVSVLSVCDFVVSKMMSMSITYLKYPINWCLVSS
jgi:hypothetical protein